MRVFPGVAAAGILLAIVVFAGCAATPVKYYPNFPSQKPSLGGLVVLQDVFIAEGTTGDTSKLDVVWNRKMGDSVLLYLTGGLVKRGYPVARSLFTSVGMPVSNRTVYSVASSAEEQKLEAGLLPKGRPPFYLDAEFDTSSYLKREWQTICRTLLQTSFTPEATHTIIADASSLGQRMSAATVCVVFATGFTVPVSQRLLEKHESTNQPIGHVADERISQASVTIYIIDVAGGELLWSDQTILGGGTIYLGKLTVLVDRLLDRLP